MGFSNISVFWWEKIRHFVFKAEFENICYNISFWLKTKIARILKCVVKFVFGFSTFENSYSVFAKKNTQIEKRVAFNISRSSVLLKMYFFFDNVFLSSLFGDYSLHLKIQKIFENLKWQPPMHLNYDYFYMNTKTNIIIVLNLNYQCYINHAREICNRSLFSSKIWCY